MKYLTLSLFLMFGFSTYAQKTDAQPYHSPYLEQIDTSFIDHILFTKTNTSTLQTTLPASTNVELVINNERALSFKNLEHQYKSANNPKFEFLISFYNQMARLDNTILQKEYLKKPSLDNLLSVYLQIHLRDNFNPFNKHIQTSKSKLVSWELEHFPTMESLLINYYASIFYNVFEKDPIKKSFNLDFDELGLSKKEGSVLYYVVMMRWRQSRYYTNISCKSFLQEANTIPTFNGQNFLEFESYKFDQIIKTIHHQNKFCDAFPLYEDAAKEMIDAHKRCSKKTKKEKR